LMPEGLIASVGGLVFMSAILSSNSVVYQVLWFV